MINGPEDVCDFAHNSDQAYYNLSEFSWNLTQLFSSKENMTEFSFILDNTGFPNNSLYQSVNPDKYVVLFQNMEVVYTLSNKYFVLTMVFIGITVLLIILLGLLIYTYRKKKKEYKNFLKQMKKTQDINSRYPGSEEDHNRTASEVPTE